MPLIMDYVIDCNEQNEFEVKYKGEVIGKDRFHHNAVSMIMSNIAGRCERAEKMLAAIVESWTAYQATIDAVGLENKMHWVEFLQAMRSAQQAGAAAVAKCQCKFATDVSDTVGETCPFCNRQRG